MIKIPMWTSKELSLFNEKKVIIYMGAMQRELYDVFKRLNIQSIICVSNYMQAFKMFLLGRPVVLEKNLTKFKIKYPESILQESEIDRDGKELLKCKAQQLGIEFSHITTGELLLVNGPLNLIEKYEHYLKSTLCINKKKMINKRKSSRALERILSEEPKEVVVVCSPPKTADHTLMNTFEELNKIATMQGDITGELVYLNIWHKPKRLHKVVHKKRNTKMKVIIGIREPISQNISVLYEELSGGYAYDDWILGELVNESKESRRLKLENMKKLFEENGDEAQALWIPFIKRFVEQDSIKEVNSPRTIQQFIPEFQKNVVDILAYPFDKDKGYAIVKENNIEVFVYQLEKLNEVVPQLSKWLEVPFDHLVMSNVGESKWLGASYKQAQKELKITQEYFNQCFEQPYVKHCYSENDIKKFKQKWKNHIERDDE